MHAKVNLHFFGRQFTKSIESDFTLQNKTSRHVSVTVIYYIYERKVIEVQDYPLCAGDPAGFDRRIQDERRSKSKNIPQQRIKLQTKKKDTKTHCNKHYRTVVLKHGAGACTGCLKNLKGLL